MLQLVKCQTVGLLNFGWMALPCRDCKHFHRLKTLACTDWKHFHRMDKLSQVENDTLPQIETASTNLNRLYSWNTADYQISSWDNSCTTTDLIFLICTRLLFPSPPPPPDKQRLWNSAFWQQFRNHRFRLVSLNAERIAKNSSVLHCLIVSTLSALYEQTLELKTLGF